MSPETDPSFEIRRAIDREAARRFDADRIAAALERGARSERAAVAAANRSPSGGPFARVPVPIQWVGVAAAVIAALTGLRSVYLEFTTREGTRRIESPVTAGPPKSPLDDRASEPEGRREEAPAPQAGTRPVPRRSRDDAAREARPVPQVIDHSVGVASAGATGPVATEPAPTPPTSEGAVVAGPPSSAEPPDRPARAASESPRSFGVFFPGGPAVAAVGGVRSAALSVGGRRLPVTVYDIPEVGATLVTVASAASPFHRPDSRTTADRVTPAATEAPGPEEGSGSMRKGAYYLRLLSGGALDAMASAERGISGTGFQVVPLHELEVWGDRAQRSFLATAFDLRAVVTESGALVPTDKNGTASASLVAAAGETVVEIELRGEEGATAGVHSLELHIARKPARGLRASESRTLDATLHVQDGRVVVLGIPEALLGGEGSLASPWSNMTFVALSPRFDGGDATRDPDSLVVTDEGVEPPILIDGPEPRYPDEARELRPTGKVVLRAVVRRDGSVDGIQVVEAPGAPGSELLVSAAVSAVREWRYLPAQRRGETVHAYVTIPIEFRSSD